MNIFVLKSMYTVLNLYCSVNLYLPTLNYTGCSKPPDRQRLKLCCLKPPVILTLNNSVTLFSTLKTYHKGVLGGTGSFLETFKI